LPKFYLLWRPLLLDWALLGLQNRGPQNLITALREYKIKKMTIPIVAMFGKISK